MRESRLTSIRRIFPFQGEQFFVNVGRSQTETSPAAHAPALPGRHRMPSRLGAMKSKRASGLPEPEAPSLEPRGLQPWVQAARPFQDHVQPEIQAPDHWPAPRSGLTVPHPATAGLRAAMARPRLPRNGRFLSRLGGIRPRLAVAKTRQPTRSRCDCGRPHGSMTCPPGWVASIPGFIAYSGNQRRIRQKNRNRVNGVNGAVADGNDYFVFCAQPQRTI